MNSYIAVAVIGILSFVAGASLNHPRYSDYPRQAGYDAGYDYNGKISDGYFGDVKDSDDGYFGDGGVSDGYFGNGGGN